MKQPLFQVLLLLLFSNLLFLTACSDKESSMLAKITQFNYSVNIGYPEGYYAIYDRSHSFLSDDKGKPLISFGGWIAAGAGWGTGVQSTVLSAKNIMPSAFKVRWFSPTEDQFWEGEFTLPQQKLYQMIKRGYPDPFYYNKQKTYSKFTVNVAPGGLVVLWLGGGAQKFQIGAFQAEKIELDWPEFVQGAFAYGSDSTRSEFIADMLKNEDDPDKIRHEIATGTLPTDSAPWKRLQHKYLWRLQLNTPFILKDYRAWHANAESYYTYADNVNEYQNRAVPYWVTFTFLKPNQQLDKIRFELDQEETIAAYEKLAGEAKSTPVELYLKMNEDMSEAEIYLKNSEDQVKLTIKRIYLANLY